MIQHSTLGLNGDDPTVAYTPSRTRRLARALRTRRDRRAHRLADVVAISPPAP
jgi:hypothetical protein